MSDVLIEQLYDPQQCGAIRALYKEDKTVHELIREAIGAKLATNSEKIVTTNPIDMLCLICLTSKFATSEDECYRIAVTVYQYYDSTEQMLPLITEDTGLKFASKTLIALSFYAKALEKRWEYRGAPSPSYYRNASKLVYRRYNQEDIAEHHEQWEGFLGELFV